MKTKVQSQLIVPFALLLAALSFSAPTELLLVWDGIPFSSKLEGWTVLIFILLAFSVVLRILTEGRLSFDLSVWQTRFLVIVATFSALLLAIKLFLPAVNQSELCFSSPYLRSEKLLSKTDCALSLEKNQKELQFGNTTQHPWKLLFLNRLAFNHYSCSKTDFLCQRLVKLRETGSDPFELKIKIPRERLLNEATLNLRYLGEVAVRFNEGSDSESISYPFSKSLSEIQVPLPESTDSITVLYRNYHCDPKTTNCDDILQLEPLSLAQAHLSVENSKKGTFISQLGNFFILCITAACFFLLGLELHHLTLTKPDWKNFLLYSAIVATAYLLNFWPSERYLVHTLLILLFFLGSIVLPPLLKTERVAQLLFLLLGGAWALYSRRNFSPFDTQSLYQVGDDWLSYASMSYDQFDKGGLFFHPSMILSKPFYIYYRTFWAWLFGDGTQYFEETLRFSAGLLPFVLGYAVFVAHYRHIQEKRRLNVLTLYFGIGIAFWVCQFSSRFFLKYPQGLSEIPMWIAGLTALFSFPSLVAPTKEAPGIKFYAVFFLFLIAITIRSLVLLPYLYFIFLLLAFGVPKQQIAKPFWLLTMLFGAVISLHTVPYVLAHKEEIIRYLGWQFVGTGGADQNTLSFSRKIERCYFEGPLRTIVPAFLILLIELAIRKKALWTGVSIVLGFVFLILIPHASIVEAAAYPRHFVLPFFLVAVATSTLLLFHPPIEKIKNLLSFLQKDLK